MTTAMVEAPRSFMERTFWPEFEALQRELRSHLNEVTERVVEAALRVEVRAKDHE